jgi:hypothetical protein
MRLSHAMAFALMILVVMLTGFAFRASWNSPVKGSVTPSNAGARAWVFSAHDTANAPVLEGNFMIENVKPGNYTLMIEGVPPYRNTIKESIQVVDGQPTDAGVIEMNK